MRGRWCNCICSFFTQSSLRSGHFALLRQLFMKVFTEEVSKCIVWLPLSLHLVLPHPLLHLSHILSSPSPPLLPHFVNPFSTSLPTSFLPSSSLSCLAWEKGCLCTCSGCGSHPQSQCRHGWLFPYPLHVPTHQESQLQETWQLCQGSAHRMFWKVF